MQSTQDTSSPTQDLCLLSLDGGGVQGLSTLLILKQLMLAINPTDPPRPCHYFDLIAGTSTGGLIALMLGRMQLTVDECITAYEDLSAKVFPKPRHRRFQFFGGNTQGRFDHKALENRIKELLNAYRRPVDTLLKEPPKDNACKT